MDDKNKMTPSEKYGFPTDEMKKEEEKRGEEMKRSDYITDIQKNTNNEPVKE